MLAWPKNDDTKEWHPAQKKIRSNGAAVAREGPATIGDICANWVCPLLQPVATCGLLRIWGCCAGPLAVPCRWNLFYEAFRYDSNFQSQQDRNAAENGESPSRPPNWFTMERPLLVLREPLLRRLSAAAGIGLT